MEFISEKVLIKVNEQDLSNYKEGYKKVDGTTLDLVMPTKWREYDEDIVPQVGEVVAVPRKRALANNSEHHEVLVEMFGYPSLQLPVEVEVGDVVYCHHLLVQDENKVTWEGEEYYMIDHRSIYCKFDKDGNPIMLNTFNFVEAVEEDGEDYVTKSGIYLKPILEGHNKELTGKLVHINQHMKELGPNEGDTVYFQEDSECAVIIQGKPYYRISNHRIMAYEQRL